MSYIAGILLFGSALVSPNTYIHVAEAQELEPPVVEVATTTPPALSQAVLCNCYLFVKSKYPSFPQTAKLKTNTTPKVGAVAIFNYPHYAIITDFDEEGFWVDNTNWKRCTRSTNYFRWDNPRLKGFWSP